MNDIELVASLKIDFDYDAQLVAAYKRLENTDAEGLQEVAHAIVGRNMLVTKLNALSDAGYDMDSRPSRSVLREICSCDEILAVHGLV